jgi:hypothetical protein
MATNWDKDKPAGTDKIRDSDDLIRANNTALEDALGRNHNFPGDEGSNAGEHTVVECQDQSADPSTPANIISIYNNGNTLFARFQSDGSIVELGAIPIPVGTKMLFMQNAAPTNWTFDAANNDRVILNTSTVGEGGDVGGSWTISGVTVDNHQLTIAEMPAHTHGFNQSSVTGGGGQRLNSPGTAIQSGSTGGDGSHNHGLTADGTWRPLWVKSITCTKD